jgi:hypothetical protein
MCTLAPEGATGTRTTEIQSAVMRRLLAAAAAFALAALPGCGGSLTLHAPGVVSSVSRDPVRVDLDPIELRQGAVVGEFAPPGPAAVLTAAMGQELAGRALLGGEAGGYDVHCALDRFALRIEERITESAELVALYADLACEVKRARDGVAVWRGELRGRACAEGSNILGGTLGVTQRLVDRTLSDAARELASDLAIRALGLRATPSARAFADEGEQRAAAGLDDTPWGAAALQENPASVDHALKTLDAHDMVLRAAAWNVVAMAAGPGDPWPAASAMVLDDEPLVRFEQYKALARRGSPESLAQLRAAADKDGDSVLAELARDAVASGGIGLERARRTNGSAATNGTTASP